MNKIFLVIVEGGNYNNQVFLHTNEADAWKDYKSWAFHLGDNVDEEAEVSLVEWSPESGKAHIELEDGYHSPNMKTLKRRIPGE
jgi:hypothetical protein